MEFRIADTFTDSLARLTADEQKHVKTTAFDLQLNPAHPSLQFHKLDRAKDARFWSVRVSSDIRVIVHRSETSLLLCYVDHHDNAYAWAERRKLETHPKTGAAQFVEVRETVVEIPVPKYIDTPVAKPRLFARFTDDELLSFGVPAEWLADVHAANEDSLLSLADHLPREAAESLLEIATGSQPKPKAVPVVPVSNPFEHPDALRRFRAMGNIEELARALEFPWEKWTTFLHPAQRSLVEKDFQGPARVAGTAGTGKTIVALHRAVFLARSNPDARVLLTTFTESLANALHTKLRLLVSKEPRLADRIDVESLDKVAARLYSRLIRVGKSVSVADESFIHGVLHSLVASQERKMAMPFLIAEWTQLVDPWQIRTWEQYKNVSRLGRKTRLSETQRAATWAILEQLWKELASHGLQTVPGLLTALAAKLGETGAGNRPYDFAVVDEAQDLGVAELKFLIAAVANKKNGLFFAGDLGQRIFQTPFSWKSLGVDVRGRSTTLKINYRTSHQIRRQADRLLGVSVSDVDGNIEERKGTISIFNGPQPEVITASSESDEISRVAAWLSALPNFAAQEIGVIVRSGAQLHRAKAAVEKAGLAFKVLDERVDTTVGRASVCTMSLAKGLEFRAVAVMACDNEVLPLQSRIETVGDESDLEEVYSTERHLLYVACTRARDRLLVSAAGDRSEFLDDLGA